MKRDCKNILYLLAIATVSSTFARDLKDVELKSSATETVVKVYFTGSTAEGDYPMYFQKFDGAKQTLTLSFLETETQIPLGRHALEPLSPGLEELQIKKMTSPSGKTFLGLELKLLDPLTADAPVEPIPKGGLKITIGQGSKKKFSWSLIKSLKAREDYLAAKAEPPPADMKEAKEVKDEKPKAIDTTKKLAEAIGSSDTKPKSDPEDKEISQTSQKAPVKVAKTAIDSFPAGISTAHEAGSKLDAGHAKTALSLSKVFSPGNNGKPMIMLKDSSDMKDKLGAEGKTIKKIPLGLKVVRLASQDGWMKVIAGEDTGFVRKNVAVYADEITEAQEKTLKSMLEAKQAKLEAMAAKLAAKEAKAAAEAAAKASAEAAAKATAEAAAKVASETAAKPVTPTPTGTQAVQTKSTVQETKSTPTPLPTAQAQVEVVKTEAPKLSISGNPELAEKLAQEKKTAEEERLRIEPEENRITYNSFGRRDPFIPVDQGSLDNGIDIDQMKVVGIIWQSSEPLAVLEHTRESNISYTVKQGDPIHNGRVGKITRDAVTFDISEYGISRSYSLKLVSSKEGTKK